MPDERSIGQQPRARALADLPLEGVIEESDLLARLWVSQLVLLRPLAAAGKLPFDELAETAPAMLAQVLRSLRSQHELERLLDGTGAAGDPGDVALSATAPVAVLAALGELAGAAVLVDAVEALRGLLWQAVLDRLPVASFDARRARLEGDVGDRLAYVCSALLARALAAGPQRSPRAASVSAADQHEAPTVSDPIVILDERFPGGESERSRAGGAERADAIEIRDTRSGERSERRSAQGPAAWIGSIGARLRRFEQDREPFAVVLMEIVLQSRSPLEDWLGELEPALSRELSVSGGGTLTRERAGRYWLIASRPDRTGAHALALALERAAAAAAVARGLNVAVFSGSALCPEDGSEAAALAAHADIGLYAARWEARAAAARGGSASAADSPI
jgi:hypothetical protein